MSLHDAVAKYVENGDVLATGGFTTNRKPYAAVSEILRQGQKDFIVYAGPGGGEVDMLIGEGRVAAYINCYTANSRSEEHSLNSSHIEESRMPSSA